MKFGRGIGREIIEKIKSAKNRIWIVSPFISEKYAKLLKSRYEEKLDVRIITLSKVDLECARRPKIFAHAKIYIIDDSGFYGSMNLTDDGVNRNYEIITQVKSEELPELEREFLELWKNSLPMSEKDICDGIIFEKVWERRFRGIIFSIRHVEDRFYITTSKELICLSSNGKILWRTPIISRSYQNLRFKNYGDYLLVYDYYPSEGSKKTDCVKIYLIRSDGVIVSSFDYRGIDPWAVYYDPEHKAIGIIELVNDNYKVVGLDINGDRIEGYSGRKDLKFFIKSSVVRGDGTVELKIPSGDYFRVSPKFKKIVAITLLDKNESKGPYQRKDTIVKVEVYDVDSKSLYNESTVNLGKADLRDFVVDDDGRVYLLTEDSVYIVDNDVQKITIVEREPMFETPEKKITIRYPGSIYTHEYYYESCETICQKIVLLNDQICILLVDILKYTNEFRTNERTYYVFHAIIYSKKDFKLSQVLKSISRGKWIRTPQIFPFDDGFVIYQSEKMEIVKYFRKVDLRPKIEEFMNFVHSVMDILKINPENYTRTISRLCKEGSEKLLSYLESEKRNLIQKLQTNRFEIEKELAEIISKMENAIQSGYSTKKAEEILNFAKDALKNINEKLPELEEKLEMLKMIIQKQPDQILAVENIEIERIKNRLYRVILKIKTDSELGVTATIKNINGNVEPYFEKRPIEVCPEATVDFFIKLREDPPLPVVIELEYKYFEKTGVIEKLFLIS